MDTIFTVQDMDDFSDKLNLDELYERKQKHDLSTLATYNKLLARIHSRIKIASRHNVKEQHCFYVIPEMMIGVPKYDHGACIAYLIDKLRDNGFIVKYTHPNLVFISWKHWIPSYVRNEIRKKTGISLDGYGNKIIKKDDEKNHSDPQNANDILLNRTSNTKIANKEQNYKEIESYKPSGKLIYHDDLFKKLEKKFVKL